MGSMDILLATTNRGKIHEMTALLAQLPPDTRLVTPSELHLSLNVNETAGTYAGNAILKAETYSKKSGLMTLADDSGLEVDALGGAPGIHSARYSPQPGASDLDRRSLLLINLKGFRRPWQARFRCIVALSEPGRRTDTYEGICPGEIIPEERGINGFGYDPIFLIPGLGKTMAELSLDEKNQLSHRARAVQAAIVELKKRL
jgi:XTP/dITP diphosphohydrolase